MAEPTPPTDPAGSPPVVYRFVGEANAYINNVPARDLTEDDVDALDDDHRAAVEASPLYTATGARAGDEKE